MVELSIHNNSLRQNEELLIKENKETSMRNVKNDIELKEKTDKLNFLEKMHKQVVEELK